MSLKITIEVDGQTEQQLAPVIEQLAAYLPAHASPEMGSSTQAHYHENAALLQQQIQQLVAQNQLLKAQSSYPQPRLAAAASTSNSAIPIPLDVQPPALPVQYQATPRDRTRYQLQRVAQRLASAWVRLRLIRQNMASGAAAVRRWSVRHAQACTQAR